MNFAEKPATKCCMVIPAKSGLLASGVLNCVVILLGSLSLQKGDPASLYGAPQEQVDIITKDMDKKGDQYKFWVMMQSVIWIGYVFLCLVNLVFLFRMVIIDDGFYSRMSLSRSYAITALFSLFNVVMGLLGFYFTPPEVFMFVVFAHLAYTAYHYA